MNRLADLEPDLRRGNPAQQVDPGRRRQGQGHDDRTQPDGQPVVGNKPGSHSRMPSLTTLIETCSKERSLHTSWYALSTQAMMSPNVTR